MTNQYLSALPNLRAWSNDGSPLPRWVKPHVTEERGRNGTFLIDTPIGTARVHAGDIVVEHAGSAWARSPGEIQQFIDGLVAESQPSAPAIGPGKAAQFGTKSKAKATATRKVAYRLPHGSMPSIEWVHTSTLSVDTNYKRSIENAASRRLIRSIAANFDWRLCAPLVVSRRADGSRVIIDGQHRWAAATLRGDLPQLPCCIFSYDSPEEEARMFIVANRSRRPMTRLDDYHAAIAAADEDALEIQQIVRDAGLRVARDISEGSTKPGRIVFTAALASALRKHGPAIVSAALTTMAEAFPGQRLTHGGALFGGLVLLFAQPPKGFEPDDLVPALRTFDAAGWGDFVSGVPGGDRRNAAMKMAILESLSSPIAIAAE